jgi:hypothetical protein
MMYEVDHLKKRQELKKQMDAAYERLTRARKSFSEATGATGNSSGSDGRMPIRTSGAEVCRALQDYKAAVTRFVDYATSTDRVRTANPK